MNSVLCSKDEVCTSDKIGKIQEWSWKQASELCFLTVSLATRLYSRALPLSFCLQHFLHSSRFPKGVRGMIFCISHTSVFGLGNLLVIHLLESGIREIKPL